MNTAAQVSILAAAGILAPSQAEAHGIWLAQRSDKVVLVYGEGADDLDMVKREALVETVAAYDADFKPIPATRRISGLAMVVDTETKPTIVTAVLQNGVWSRRKGGEYEKKTLEEMPDAEYAANNIKYAVAIQAPLTGPLPVLPGQALQIVPLGALPEKSGARLRYRVLFQGKPVAGAHLINDLVNDPDAATRVTRADGTVTLPVRNQGLNVIRAVYDGPSDDPARYRHVEHTATLSFALAHEAD